ncbi:hypothetical protein EIB75_10695 [Epilithonimonas vandammei]|uniref:Phage head morphogenesis domain-containing protein n=1 Tax=Epilithonimonas vandammei TaxID=2487072 RepID=A0A3G8ZF32_9FLAO|nr:phage minor head protein [Epilithonimonas vandammei]AZI53891.1 hypothetical protein EIB75_00855 [Epilithonimonas vandammei]AZI55690.1 hypothetical protein EIB75_10695 [Epilithonimonas vandammei]
MTEQYKPCDCDYCRTLNLAHNPEDNRTVFQKVLKTAEKAFKKLYEVGSYKPDDLTNVKEYKQLINETAKVFNLGISHEVPEEMKSYLEKDAFIFSGLKTHAQLSEARSFLKDADGNIRPYHLFEQDILKLNEKYNLNYLDAEWQFAQSSSQSAANWSALSDDERYNLQYRTAGDERVRASHDALNGTTLPKKSAFWISYYPPNGWRCRCIAILVLASKYPATDLDKATSAAEKATTQIGKNGKNKLEMFRFNPGIEKRLFPKGNAYVPKHCDGAKLNLSGLIGLSKFVLNAENERCQAKKIIEGLAEKKWNINQVLKSPRENQFKTIFTDESGGTVKEHLLITKGDDYSELLKVAKSFAKSGKNVELLPEINSKEKTARKIVFPNLQSEKSNPDLRVGNSFFDLKRPAAIKNIVGNANKADKQGAIAIISDSRLDKVLTDAIMLERVRDIFKGDYSFSKVLFYHKNKLSVFNRTGDK